MKKKGIFIFSKEDYIELVRSKRFGGSKRTINILSIEKMNAIAIAKVALESEYLKFLSNITCVFVNDKWQIISNVPTIETK